MQKRQRTQWVSFVYPSTKSFKKAGRKRGYAPCPGPSIILQLFLQTNPYNKRHRSSTETEPLGNFCQLSDVGKLTARSLAPTGAIYMACRRVFSPVLSYISTAIVHSVNLKSASSVAIASSYN